MSDSRDFNMGRLLGVEAVPATGVPESCSMADAPEALQRERDELREQVARLEGELQQERDNAFTEAEHWQRQRDRLRTALERYGQHDEGCEWHDHRWHGQRGPCTCALAEALTLPEVDEG